MLFFDQKYVEEHLTMDACIKVMEDTLKQERSGVCVQYLRTAINMPNTNILGMMPAYDARGYFGVKVISVYHDNVKAGYPSHQGQIILFGKEHGNVLAVIDAMSVTKIRTGAVSAAATKALACKEPKILAVLGCGAQGHSHLEAMTEIFGFETVRCWDMVLERAESLAETARQKGCQAYACRTVEESVKDADIICTVTPAREPILKYEWVKPGAHINAVGACAPAAREIDSALAKNSRFFCDNEESILHESGDFLIPMKEGLYGEEHLLGTAGDVLLGKIPGRTSESQITVFDAVGMAVEDIACAIHLYEDHVK